MDNRWRFLYCGMTELWGHVQRAGAGNGKPGASGVPGREANPPLNGKTRRGPKSSREARELCVKKSRYCLYRTRTVNRHRWMRRGS